MGNLWLKIKIWTKGIIASLLAIYLLIFILKNGGSTAKFWFWFNRNDETSLLFLVFFAFVAGGVVTLLLMTTFRTVRQIKELRARTRTEKLEREVSDMRNKAAMLQTRPSAVSAPGFDVIPPATSDIEEREPKY